VIVWRREVAGAGREKMHAVSECTQVFRVMIYPVLLFFLNSQFWFDFVARSASTKSTSSSRAGSCSSSCRRGDISSRWGLSLPHCNLLGPNHAGRAGSVPNILTVLLPRLRRFVNSRHSCGSQLGSVIRSSSRCCSAPVCGFCKK